MYGRRRAPAVLWWLLVVGLAVGLLAAGLLLFLTSYAVVRLPAFSCAPSVSDTPQKESIPAMALARMHSLSLSKDKGECDTTAHITRSESRQTTPTAHQTGAPAGPRV